MIDTTVVADYPTAAFQIGQVGREIVRVTSSGRVILAPGVSLDAASRAFWKAIEKDAPGTCQRMLDERAKEAKAKP